MQLLQAGGKLTQLRVEQAVHRSGVAALVCFVHGLLGDDAILFNEAHKHVPLAAVLHACAQDPAQRSVVNRAVNPVNHRLKKIIGLFKLIPECNIILRELKTVKIALFCDLFAQKICTGENPAAPAAFLVCHGQGRNFHRKMEPIFTQAAVVEGHIGKLRFGQRICHRPAGGAGVVAGRVLRKLLHADGFSVFHEKRLPLIVLFRSGKKRRQRINFDPILAKKPQNFNAVWRKRQERGLTNNRITSIIQLETVL